MSTMRSTRSTRKIIMNRWTPRDDWVHPGPRGERRERGQRKYERQRRALKHTHFRKRKQSDNYMMRHMIHSRAHIFLIILHVLENRRFKRKQKYIHTFLRQMLSQIIFASLYDSRFSKRNESLRFGLQSPQRGCDASIRMYVRNL
jgi:hypothetical protein